MSKELANHGQAEPSFIIDLQLFAEGDPVDPAPTDPPADPTPPTDPPPADPAPPADPPAPQKLRVKYNHQEMEIPYEEAVAHIQKGMNYEKAVERAKQEATQAARDAWVAEQGYEWNGKPITTEAEYKEALKEKELMEKYQDKGLPEDVVAELVENRKFREQYSAKEQELQGKAEEERQAKAFFEAYPSTAPADIPQSVWEAVRKGDTLLQAYRAHELEQLKAENAELKKGIEVKQKNELNANDSTGSVKTTTPVGGFISKEDFESNKGDRNWLVKNLSTIEESRKHW